MDIVQGIAYGLIIIEAGVPDAQVQNRIYSDDDIS